MRSAAALAAGIAALAALLAGCPRGSAGHTEAVKACTAAGQSCEVAPGKLGLCVAVAPTEPCEAGPACFVCQSQH